jgi:N-methylhydantoinase B
MRHIFPDVPMNAGAFEPLTIIRPEGTFLDARYPRPVSGCAAEVSQRIAEAVFAALVQAIPDKVTAAPAGSSGNFGSAARSRARARFVLYQLSGGGYGGNADHDGLSNGCSTIGISKSPPVEIMEQNYPILYRHYALREGSGGAGQASRRHGACLRDRAAARRGARLLRHGSWPLRAAGRAGRRGWRGQHRDRVARRRGACAETSVEGAGRSHARRRPGFGRDTGRRRLWRSLQRRPEQVLEDVRLGYYTAEQAAEMFGVAIVEGGWTRTRDPPPCAEISRLNSSSPAA